MMETCQTHMRALEERAAAWRPAEIDDDYTPADGEAAGVGEVVVTTSAANMWHQGDFTPAGDNEVYYSYLDDGDPGASVTVTGLLSVFPAYVVQTVGATAR